MSRRPKKTFLQRRHTNSQQAHGKVLKVAMWNVTQWGITPQGLEWPTSKHLHLINAGEGGEKKEPPYTVSGNVNWCSHYGEQYRGS